LLLIPAGIALAVPAQRAGLPLPPLPDPDNIGQAAYTQVIQEAAPLSPKQISALRRLVDDAERTAAAPPHFAPKPVSRALTVSLMPGETPPTIHLFANYVTSILFVDAMGNPLTITHVDIGAAELFTVTWPKNQGQHPVSNQSSGTPFDAAQRTVPRQANTTANMASSKQAGASSMHGHATQGLNLVSISPKTTYAAGNISISLDGVRAPIVLTLTSGQRQIDYRVDIHVTGAGTPSVLIHSAASVNPVIPTLLTGITPDGAHALIVSHTDLQAWAYKKHFYLRTRSVLLSPAYTAMQKSADGTTVYETMPTPVVITLVNGRATQIRLNQRSAISHDDEH